MSLTLSHAVVSTSSHISAVVTQIAIAIDMKNNFTKQIIQVYPISQYE